MYTQTHTLLKVGLSCTYSKTMKPWSKWSSKDEVQHWDMCLESTELRLIGCSTELTWNQRSKSNMLTPITNLLTCKPKRVFLVTNGTIFFVWSTRWVSRFSLAAMSAIFFLIRSESWTSRQREVRMRLPVKVHRWRNQNQFFCEGETRQHGFTQMLKIQIPGNRVTRKNLRTLLVQGDLYGQRLQEQRTNTWSISHKNDTGAFWINSECEYDWKCIFLMDDISIVSWSNDPVTRDVRHCRFFKRFKTICENGTSNPTNSQTGSSSCQCSTTSIGQTQEMME